MFCPKCHYTSFDHLPSCPRCAYNWSQQKRIFNMEWMVPTASEGMNIFTPAVSPNLPQPEQSEASADQASPQAEGGFIDMTGVIPEPSQSPGEEEEIELDETDLEDLQGHSSTPSDSKRASGTASKQEFGEEGKTDDEISFEGLQEVSTDREEASAQDGDALNSADEDGREPEPDLEIELEDHEPAEGGETTSESLTIDEDELDLDITSLLDDIDSDTEDRDPGARKPS
jgi:hypothetical protein